MQEDPEIEPSNHQVCEDFNLSLACSRQRREEAARRRKIERRLSFLIFLVVITCFVLFLILYPR